MLQQVEDLRGVEPRRHSLLPAGVDFDDGEFFAAARVLLGGADGALEVGSADDDFARGGPAAGEPVFFYH